MQPPGALINRRQLLRSVGTGFGMVAASSLLAQDQSPLSVLAPRPSHFPGKAKQVIFLFLNGGPSHVD